MYCTKCGKELANNARFCTYCGAKVQQEEYPGNIKGFNGGYEEKKRAVQESFGFERSSQWIMALLQFGKIFLLILMAKRNKITAIYILLVVDILFWNHFSIQNFLELYFQRFISS